MKREKIFVGLMVLLSSFNLLRGELRLGEEEKILPPVPRLIVKFKSSPEQKKFIPAFKSRHHQLVRNISPLFEEFVGRSFKKGGFLLGRKEFISFEPEKFYLLEIKEEIKVAEAIKYFQSLPSVEYVEPDSWVKTTELDSYLYSTGTWGQEAQDLWGVHITQAKEAWSLSTGRGVIVAVVDTGVDYTHPELKERMWKNEGEANGVAGVDDDGNGFVDDIYGYNFYDNTSDPVDEQGHGTHCAGTIAASRNGVGIVGIAYECQIMALRFLSSRGDGWTSDAMKCWLYGIREGARVFSNSWGLGALWDAPFPEEYQFPREVAEEIYRQGGVIVASAGNSSYVTPHTPSCLPWIIGVGASGPFDSLCQFSCRGINLDVCAPGGGQGYREGYIGMYNVLSCLSSLSHWWKMVPAVGIGGKYLRLAGTSMACPHVSGLAALILSLHPEFTSGQVKTAIVKGCDDIEEPGWDYISGYGRINCLKSLQINTPGEYPLAVIDSPYFGECINLKAGEKVVVKGRVRGDNFSHYVLLKAHGPWPAKKKAPFLEWEEVTRGNEEILTTGVLAEIPFSQLRDGILTFELRCYTQDGLMERDIVWCNLHKVAEGEVRRNFGLTSVGYTNSFSEDINNDGKEEIISSITFFGMKAGAAEGEEEKGGWCFPVCIFNEKGEFMGDGWPVFFHEEKEKIGEEVAMEAPPAFISLGKFGEEEPLLVFPFEGMKRERRGGEWEGGWFFCFFSGAGELKNSFLLEIESEFLPGTSVVDLDKDGTEELVFIQNSPGTSAIIVYSVKNGNVVHRLLLGQGEEASGLAAIGDIDGDGELEIVCGGAEKKVYVYRADGSSLPGWPQMVDETPVDRFSIPVLGDVDGDGDREIFICREKLFGFNYRGERLSGWPQGAGENTKMTNLALGDWDGDGRVEIFVLVNEDILSSPSPYHIRIYKANGELIKKINNVDGRAFSLRDINDDGKMEILYTRESTQCLAENREGVVYRTGILESKYNFWGDVDNDGKADICNFSTLPLFKGVFNEYFTWLFQKKATGLRYTRRLDYWPWLGQNPSRTNCLPSKFEIGVEKTASTSFNPTFAYPNPFNPECYIPIKAEDEMESVRCKIYNILGQLVREIEIQKTTLRGQNSKVIYWDGRDSKGLEVPSGVYFYEGAGEGVRRMILLK